MERYFQFDLPKIQPLAEYINQPEKFQNHLNDLLLYSIWQLSLKQKLDEKNVIRQIVYRFHNSHLPEWLLKVVGDIETDYKGGFSYDHNSESGKAFKYKKEDWNLFEPEADYMREIWQTIYQANKIDQVYTWYRINQAMAILDIDYKTNNIEEILMNDFTYARLNEPKKNTAFVKIAPKAIRLFQWKELNKYELLMLMAISTLSKNKYHFTNKDQIRRRMMGATSKAEYNKLLKKKSFREFAKSIEGRKRFDNTLKLLIKKNLVKSYLVVYGSAFAQMVISLELNQNELSEVIRLKKEHINKLKEHINKPEGTPTKRAPKRYTEKVHINESIIL